jgi:hypothetical protein
MEPALKYTGKRVAEFTDAKTINKRTKAGKAQYNEIVLRLNKAEEKYQRYTGKRKRVRQEQKEFLEEQERLLLEAIADKDKQKELRKKLAEEAQLKIVSHRRLSDKELYRYTCKSGTNTDDIIGAGEAIMGYQRVRLVYESKGKVLKDSNITVTSRYTNPDSVYWRDIYVHLVEGTDKFIWEEHPGTLVITSEINESVKPIRLVQKFREGIQFNCVLDPLIDKYVVERDGAETRNKRYECNKVIKALEDMREKYIDGVPEGEPMEELAKIIKRKIEITDTFGDAYTEYNKKSSRVIQFSNTCENHVEVGHLTYKGKAGVVNSLKEILADARDRHRTNNEFYSIRKNNGEVVEVRSMRGAWKLKNDLHELYEKFNEDIGISDCKFDAVANWDLFQFVKEACTIDSAPIKIGDVECDNMIDMEKAYCQFKRSRYYKGFLGKISSWWDLTGFDSSFVRRHIGIYRFRVSEVCEVLRLLGLRDGVYVRTSVEIEQMMDLGCKVELMGGCVGSSFDFEFSEEMMAQRVIDGVKMRPYKWWSGCLGRESFDTIYEFSGSYDWCCHLKSLGHNVFYSDGIIRAVLPKKHVYVGHHIMAFITGYLRTNVIDAMLSIGVNRISHVVMDGIYLKGEAVVDGFVAKKMMEHTNFNDGWYETSIINYEFAALKDERLISNCMLCGAGGTGKTDSVLRLNGKAYRDLLFVVPQHLLGAEKKEEYGVRYTTIHTLIGIDCRAWKETRSEPAVIVLDEGTMIDSEWIVRVIAMYPNSLVYVCGDFVKLDDRVVSGQCRSGKPGLFNKVFSGLPMVMFETDYRSKDYQIKELKKSIRDKMFELYTDGEVIDAMALYWWLKDVVEVVPFDRAVCMEPGIWIAGTHATNRKLIGKGIVSGYITKDREKIYEMRGDVVETRGSFTTHSFQGSTIKDKRVYICIKDSFELAMIYTAVSRAVRMEQLVFVA